MVRPTLGVGVISLGWMGRLHTRSYKQLAEKFPEIAADVRLIAAADPLPGNQEFATKALGFERASADYREVVNDPAVDIVSICSPNYLHHEIAMAAVEAGKPFWIEKPMGISASQSRDIAKGAATAGLITSVGFNYRHAPAIQYARSLIADGKIGRITNARVWLIADYASDPSGPLTWRFDPERAGAGIVLDLLGHGADLISYLLRERIAAVSAMTDLFIDQRPKPLKEGVGHVGWEISDELGPVGNDDYVAVIGAMESGARLTMEASRVAVGPRAEYIVEVYGTEGSLRWNFEDLNHLQACIGRDNGPLQGYVNAMAGPQFPDFSRFQPGAGTSMGFDDLKAVEASLFVKGVLEHKQYGPCAGDGWAAAEVDDAIVAAAADGSWHLVAAVDAQTTFDE
ncbi:MAG: myo-inositol 2-dehydrogenase [Arachnia propionica]|nr:MAG: myo-inositol 2-dehydrogenase [Arachnia propionica]